MIPVGLLKTNVPTVQPAVPEKAMDVAPFVRLLLILNRLLITTEVIDMRLIEYQVIPFVEKVMGLLPVIV